MSLQVRSARVVGCLSLVATAGCAAIGTAPPQPAEAGVTQEAPAVKPTDAPVSPQRETAAKPPPARVGEPVPTAPPPKALPPKAPGPKKEAAVPAPAKPSAPPLDLASLEKRLKDTYAIGVFTKLTLKNQVDDLIERFKAHYDGSARTTLAELRQRFDLLMLKVLSLLQDRDASLAAAIGASREALWSILEDPAKFRSVVLQNKG
jgi:hypothetical protein